MRASDERVLFVHAHPDDESITTGGTIAALVAEGAKVTVVTCTRGELGMYVPGVYTQAPADRGQLGDLRAMELRDAMVALGVTDHRFLGASSARRTGLEPRTYLDSGMSWAADGNAERLLSIDAQSLCAAPISEIVDDLRFVIAQTSPTAIISYGPHGLYGHPDQVRVHDAVIEAARHTDIAVYQVDKAASRGVLQLDVSDYLPAKRMAIAAHRSQIRVIADDYLLPGGERGRIGEIERYRLAHAVESTRRPRWPEPGGSFAALVAGSVIALILGVATGVLTTFAHQSRIVVSGVTVPTGALLGAAMITALLVGLRLVSKGRLFAVLAGIGVLGAIFILSLPSVGGSVLVPDNVLGRLWTILPAITIAVVVAWPRAGTFARLRQMQRRPATAGGIMERPKAPKGRRSS
jgi:N-acetyl-1-D-myo-inositol-2-amino-2-deoxy-alpha-D-glucopyranoside deacetylase